MVTCVATTVQLLQPHQSHVIRGQLWDSFLSRRAEVNAVEAAAADERNSLVAVGFGVPCVAAVLLLAKFLPHITDTSREAHFDHLTAKPDQELNEV